MEVPQELLGTKEQDIVNEIEGSMRRAEATTMQHRLLGWTRDIGSSNYCSEEISVDSIEQIVAEDPPV